MIRDKLSAIRRLEDRFFNGKAYFAFVHVERADDFDILWPPAADLVIHQTRRFRLGAAGGVIFTIKLDALYERTGTVADADQRHPYFFHSASIMKRYYYCQSLCKIYLASAILKGL